MAIGLAARVGAAAVIGVLALGAAAALASQARAADGASAHDFSFTSIDGAPMPLSAHRGKVMLVVNTASHCGFTHQYAGLQSLWDARRDQNFILIGTPSDDFNQEKATEAEVKEFCEVNFAIDFPMTEIMNVRGSDAHPFYKFAARQTRRPNWNFNKYLIDQNGVLVRRYGSTATPNEIARDVDALLAGG